MDSWVTSMLSLHGKTKGSGYKQGGHQSEGGFHKLGPDQTKSTPCWCFWRGSTLDRPLQNLLTKGRWEHGGIVHGQAEGREAGGANRCTTRTQTLLNLCAQSMASGAGRRDTHRTDLHPSQESKKTSPLEKESCPTWVQQHCGWWHMFPQQGHTWIRKWGGSIPR